MGKYAVVYERLGQNWSAYSPDVEGCVSVGDTLEEVAANFREALESHMQTSADLGYSVPEPTSQVGYVEVNTAKPAAAPAEPNPIAELARLYLFREQTTGEIGQFLSEHAYLVPLLLEVHDAFLQYFADTPLVLDLVYDPEESSKSAHLVAAAQTSLALEGATAALERLDREWWLDKLGDAQGKLSLDMELL